MSAGGDAEGPVEDVHPSGPIQSLRGYFVRYLWLVGIAYVTILVVFVAYEVLTGNQLAAILGTLVFTAVATLIASLASSRDFERFSQSQVEALAEISRGDREVAMEQVKVLR